MSEPATTLDTLAELLARLVDALAPVDGVVPEALDAAQSAKLLGISRSRFYELDGRGLVPAAVFMGDGDRGGRWVRRELIAWLLNGCPSRQRWALMKDSAVRRAG